LLFFVSVTIIFVIIFIVLICIVVIFIDKFIFILCLFWFSFYCNKSEKDWGFQHSSSSASADSGKRIYSDIKLDPKGDGVTAGAQFIVSSKEDGIIPSSTLLLL
jgi:hypothetical protein